MALKKFRAKTRKGVVKRIKVSNGGDLSKGKLITSRAGDNHLNLRKTRERKLRAKTQTTLSKAHKKLRKVLNT